MSEAFGCSQLGQEFFVLEVLGGLRNGFFLDSGASDGVGASNTYLLETEFGWSGICIEPNEMFFNQLIRNRNCTCVNCCLYDRDGLVDFVEANTLGGILEEYHPAHLEYAMRTFDIPEDLSGKPATVLRPTRTILSVLKEYAAPPIIDYWSLDTEGSELAILKSFPFHEYSFRVLTVEHNRLPVRYAIREFLEERGYRLVRELDIDDCYLLSGNNYNGSWQSSAWKQVRRCKSV
jgi:FkbM family methyltransferase